ncbi:hypothetical protein TRAPUB_328 [Trametes pubescens]|uniref:Uncharacterized protein n=1 Tax=Trametes pubescens TaxID=154538 RepID=A0A1M2VMI7_TRAPU|nr:hypothetical protein TRAPUB_328 [Trametes pubescens]
MGECRENESRTGYNHSQAKRYDKAGDGKGPAKGLGCSYGDATRWNGSPRFVSPVFLEADALIGNAELEKMKADPERPCEQAAYAVGLGC